MSAPIGGDLGGYYRIHAPIYDLTRPAFLFGRRRLVEDLARLARNRGMPDPRILEIGCGTGSNLALLARHFPQSRLTGVDLAAPMLAVARRRLAGRAELVHVALGSVALNGPYDLIVASYMLSMTGEAQPRCIAAARAERAPGGLLGVVDFLSTPVPAFARWMALNHVRFDPTLPQRLAADATPLQFRSHRAYAGAWRWFSWIGG